MPTIHPTALVDPGAELADDVIIGPFTIVQNNVTIDSGTQIHSHALIASGARIGKRCIVHHGAVVSSIPQDLKFAGEETTLEIGDETVIREYCDLNRGTVDHGKTEIGKNVFLMAYVHVAHDCVVGDKVILANGVQLAGHVTIGNWVTIGGLTPVHQFCTVGEHSFVGGGYRVVQDVPPYILAASEPLTYRGPNVVGLERRGFPKENIMAIRKCYRFLYRSKLNTSQAVEKIKNEVDDFPEVRKILEFIETNHRGLIR